MEPSLLAGVGNRSLGRLWLRLLHTVYLKNKLKTDIVKTVIKKELTILYMYEVVILFAFSFRLIMSKILHFFTTLSQRKSTFRGIT